MNRREFLQGAAGVSGLAALSISLGAKCAEKRQFYQGKGKV